MRSPATLAAVGAIGAYQRYVSPRKGYCCAHRACTGGMSCSAYAKFEVLRRGVFAALPRIRDRLIQCSEYATDPMKGKISEDDPGPLGSDECGRWLQNGACAGCLLVEPLFWIWS